MTLFPDSTPDSTPDTGTADTAGGLAVPDPQQVLVEAGTWITRTAWRLHARMPWTEVEDMVQHGVLTALELRDRYDPGRGVPFGLFIKPRVLGAMIDISRRAGSIKRREESFLAEADDTAPPDALDLIIQCQDVAALADEIDRLPYLERTAISLFYLEELRNKDVARIMGVSEVQALRYRERALACLAEGLGRRLPRPHSEIENTGKHYP
ncbi:MAG: sigma-70 family RNA polymerase sigma factor [Allgaiera sp.]|jgi:RNA polymerase sigma factor (sigma-70 family)|nr:sigma-70 family RNA polymerase sigma factor [Allgaiera sp.]